jgi:hypothetical protein
MAVAAMAMANSLLAGAYHTLFHHDLPWSPVAKLNTPHLWINDALMAIFFFVIGMEIKKEVLVGELSDFKRASLPLLGALGGMVVPATIYLLIANSSEMSRGWGIPMATDIAFALACLALFRNKIPAGLKVFLLALAIVDDLGAVLVIALFYTQKIHLSGLLWLAGRRFCGAGFFLCLHLGFLFQLPGVTALGKVLNIPGDFFALAQCLHTCILCLVWLAGRRFCGAGFFLFLHLGFLFQLPGVAVLEKILNIPGGFFTLAQCLHTDIIFLVLVDFPVRRRPGKAFRAQVHAPANPPAR